MNTAGAVTNHDRRACSLQPMSHLQCRGAAATHDSTKPRCMTAEHITTSSHGAPRARNAHVSNVASSCGNTVISFFRHGMEASHIPRSTRRVRELAPKSSKPAVFLLTRFAGLLLWLKRQRYLNKKMTARECKARHLSEAREDSRSADFA